jgi:hypothetical protein
MDSLCLCPETGNWTCPLFTPKINRSQHTKYLKDFDSNDISYQVHQVGLPHVQVVWILLFTSVLRKRISGSTIYMSTPTCKE